MNLMFWKKKKAPEESDPDAADVTVVAGKTDAALEKPGLWTRLKNALSLSRKKSEPVEEGDARHKENKHPDKPDKQVEGPPPKPGFLARLKIALLPARKKTEPDEKEKDGNSARRKGDKHPNEETDAPPAKPGFMARLKKSLMPGKKNEPAEEEKPEEHKSTAKRTDRNQPDEEPQTANVPEKKPMKRLVIFLALLIPLAAGGGFFAATKLAPPPHQEAPTAKPAAPQETKTDGEPAMEPPKTAEQAPTPETEQPPGELSPTPADNATPTAEAPPPPAEEPVAEAPPPTEEDIQTQIQAMKKHNLEMQAQIEALKKQPSVAKSVRSSATPRDGVLIINGKDTKESVQGLKKVIESMNTSSGTKEPGKK